jgi:hypothetical protein
MAHFLVKMMKSGDQFGYLANDSALKIYKASLMYIPQKEEKGAALNFHLSAREKRDVLASFNNAVNQAEVKKIVQYLKK